jgi:glycosyltransferase involved in cell wall biosynthesis
METINATSPKLVIGLPVYNGEQYLRATLDSILSQSFTDFKLIISDNASTDATETICSQYAEVDKRIEYYRQQENLGMAGNFNFVFQPGSSPYFKWAACDDLLKQGYLEGCIKLLDQEPLLATAHSPAIRIDGRGRHLGTYKDLGLSGNSVSERYWRVLWTDNIYEVYGVMRADYIKKTKLVDTFFGAERNMLLEVLVQGNIAYLSKPLFARRDHEGTLTHMHQAAKEEGDFQTLIENHATRAKTNKLLSVIDKYKAYLHSIFRFPMPLSDRIACIGYLVEWSIRRAITDLTGIGKAYRYNLVKNHGINTRNDDLISSLDQHNFTL